MKCEACIDGKHHLCEIDTCDCPCLGSVDKTEWIDWEVDADCSECELRA